MEKISHRQWPEIIFGSSDSAESQAIRRALRAGQLRKIAARLYTTNLTDPLTTIVRRNAYQILGGLFPGAVISHRSALEGGALPTDSIILTFKYAKKITLPGFVVHLYKGAAHQPGDMPFMDNLFLASRARALLENLQPSRGKEKKTVSLRYIEESLDKLCRVYGKEELNKLRDEARKLAKSLSLEKENIRLGRIIGALLGSQSADELMTEVARARAKGHPYDNHRLELFTKLFSILNKEIFLVKKEIITSTQELYNLAFFEAYFSNYIEGTEFEVDEAADIIFHHKLMPNRPEDAHDITATFKIVANTSDMNQVPTSIEELIQLLKRRHKKLMESRSDKHPGKFKTITNRVGETLFVIPELVEGTFRKAFSLYENLPNGIARAIFMMFLVTEIHPFLDGNGRIARIMMNAELVNAGEIRIIIPTVYREDYLLALRRLSRSSDPEAYIRMLLRAQDFTANIDFSDYQKALQQLKKRNAFLQPYEGKLLD